MTALQAIQLLGNKDVTSLQTLANSSSNPTVKLVTAQCLMGAGQTSAALALVHSGETIEHLWMACMLYLKLDRLDLARQTCEKMQTKDEDAIPTQLAQVHVQLATGRSGASLALNGLQALTEQYGTSTLLSNLQAAALLQSGDPAGAEVALQEADSNDADTLINTIVALVHQDKDYSEPLASLRQLHPQHDYIVGLERVEAAFERESVKYQVAA